MKLADAIASDRLIRRKGERDWWDPQVTKFNAEDVLADDWEVKPISVTFTDTQFWDAYRTALIQVYAERQILVPYGFTAPDDVVTQLAKTLGISKL